VAGSTVAETAVRAASRRQATELAVLHGRAADPVDVRVVADGSVAGVDEDDLKVLVCSILLEYERVLCKLLSVSLSVV